MLKSSKGTVPEIAVRQLFNITGYKEHFNYAGKDDHILKLPVTLMRGGTSKGVYLLEEDLPEDHNEWDKILLRLMGSPDQKQIDGLGGSQSVTSKVAS